MFKKKNIPALIFAGLLVALLITIIVLSFVQNVFFKGIDNDYDTVLLYKSSQTKPETELPKSATGRQQQDREMFVDNMNKTGYSTMQAILEGRWNTKPKFLTYTDDDGTQKRVEAKAKEVLNYTAGADEYLIELRYDTVDPNGDRYEPQQIVVEGDTIKYDTIKFAISDSKGEVAQVKVYAYENEYFDGVFVDSEDRFVNPFYIYLNTNQLYTAITSILNGDIF